MRGKKVFTRSSADRIRVLLGEKCRSDSNRKKSIRNDIRALGFYISYFRTTKEEFTRSDFDRLVETDTIRIFPG